MRYKTQPAPVPVVKKDKCDCGLPFVYKPQEWEGETPKYLLNEWYVLEVFITCRYIKNHPKSTPKYEPFLTTKQIGHFTKVILTHTADAGKPVEIISKVASKTKKESEQNAALGVLHYLHTQK